MPVLRESTLTDFNPKLFYWEGTMESKVLKHSIVIAHHKTSVSLEEQFWSGLKEIADTRHQTLSGLVNEINANHEGNLSSAIRQFVLAYYRERSPTGAECSSCDIALQTR